MLMMQYSSGLSRFEVRKAQLRGQEDVAIAKLHVLMRPALLLSMGLIAIVAGVGGVLPAVLAALVVTLLGGFAALGLRRWLQPLANDDQVVMVVREGLMRQCTVADLVVGDTLVLTEGMIVPVDVQGAVAVTPNSVTAKLQMLLKLTVAADITVAGSRVAQDGQAQVVAVGSRRFVFAQLLPVLNDDMIIGGNVLALLMLNGSRWRQLVQPVGFVADNRLITNSEQDLDKVAMTTATTLVDNNRQTAAETAFRYNQDPVSWSGI